MLGQDSSTAGSELMALGITAQQEAVYLTLLTDPGLTLGELSHRTGHGRTRLRRDLDVLQIRGLVSAEPSASPRHFPISPDVAVAALIAHQEELFARARLAAERLTDQFHAAAQRSDATRLVEIVDGTQAVTQRYRQLQQAAQQTVRAIDRPPYADPGTPNQIQRQRMAHGVDYRVIYTPEALQIEAKLETARHDGSLGERARLLRDPPMKIAICDDRIALIPLRLEDASVAAVIHPSALLSALITLFDSIWERAAPLNFSRDQPSQSATRPSLSEDDHQILSLLAAGLRDAQIARQLGVGTRTVSRRVARLLRLLNADTRFQAGLQAGRRGML